MTPELLTMITAQAEVYARRRQDLRSAVQTALATADGMLATELDEQARAEWTARREAWQQTLEDIS